MNGKRFRIIKFRTMRQTPSLDPDSHWTVRNDHHITPLGRWLRRTNLDELPQVLNVLKGEMSIVGPRPERPFFLERFRKEVPEYMARHYVKSGITGWAQVNGWRGDTPIPERVAHDLHIKPGGVTRHRLPLTLSKDRSGRWTFSGKAKGHEHPSSNRG
jgi:lipopolysaccharide/colanic/teichoic acid biosynthesis glycosyltransferase